MEINTDNLHPMGRGSDNIPAGLMDGCNNLCLFCSPADQDQDFIYVGIQACGREQMKNAKPASVKCDIQRHRPRANRERHHASSRYSL